MIILQLAKSLGEKSKEEIINDYIDLYKKQEKLIKDKSRLEKEKEKLEHELNKYKNSNTPSSANKHLKPNTQGLKAKTGAKRGAPIGHRGATSQLANPERKIPVYVHECAHCQSKEIEFTNYVKKRIIRRLFITTAIFQYDLHEVRCKKCLNLTMPTHPDLPEKGMYDKNILAIVNYLKFKGRIVHKTLEKFMNEILKVPMSAPTSLNIIRRTSEELRPEYVKIESQIKQSDVVNGDETIHSVNGINYWIWVFCNKTYTLFKFHNRRGGTIVQDTLGKDFNGTLCSDGWQTYAVYCKDNKVRHGRCWSHAIREVEDFCKKKHIDLYNWFMDIYGNIKKAKTYKLEKTRLKKCAYWKQQLRLWIGSVKSRTDLRKLATYIENGFEEWFTALLYPEVPLDNNEAERSLRPFVIIRKIIGCFRSETGPIVYETMMSLISTWDKQGKNPYYMLQTLL